VHTYEAQEKKEKKEKKEGKIPTGEVQHQHHEVCLQKTTRHTGYITLLPFTTIDGRLNCVTPATIEKPLILDPSAQANYLPGSLVKKFLK